ncbi:MAG: sigma-70 family RNA polymerase sigma factor [Alphaproteobacteria bacterium]|nr:sigma-70 family RNA polymerase sigma factor [Alphaproteobacteria bacterium]
MHESVGEIETHLPVLRRFALALARDPELADDLVQNCVARAIERIDQFEPGTNLRAWLFTILRNMHLDDRRKVARGPLLQDIDDSTDMNLTTPPEQEWAVRLREFARSFAELPVADQDVIVLVAVDGMSYADVSEVLEVPVGTVKSRLSRARARLRGLYSDS